MTDRIRRWSRHIAHERAVGVIRYLIFVLPPLMFWVAVRFGAIALWHIAKQVVPKIRPFHAEPSATDAPATVPESQEVDSVIEELRARKRRRHAEGIDAWHRDWEQLLESAPFLPAEDTDKAPRQRPSMYAASDSHELSGIDEKPADERREMLSRFYVDVVRLHESWVARSLEDGGSLLAGDARTMWAWAEYLKSRHTVPVDGADVWQVLAAIPPGEHVEIFAPVVMSPTGRGRDKDALPKEARFGARTFDFWLLPSSGLQAEVISCPKWTMSVSGSVVDPVAETHFRLADGRKLVAYSDRGTTDRFDSRGVGESILRLPDSPLTPAPPVLGAGARTSSPGSALPKRLLGNWHSAEDVALWHMSGPLGFFGARLTGGVSDRGIDVEHPEAVAQVKMQANPVGSPQIRQLRGTRPQLRNHVFYSTSGFTRAAVAEAAETGVALFSMDDDAKVHPLGAEAKRLILEGHQRHGGEDALVAEYVSSVVERVRKAKFNYGTDNASWALRDVKGADWDRLERAEGYLKGAISALKYHPKIGVDSHKAVISHYRNADLRAAFFCQVLGLPYPGNEPLRRRKPPTAADFY
ncbi:restriction endonuclease [Arthrobacter silvisoli]|uniref:restriction endonuclease n=1 Tax=Arthrobacter silvisoli TaxID=2291022 RepID=UPI001443BA5C|nr:restriction endonuclease [Arthrobacter silvisoli]